MPNDVGRTLLECRNVDIGVDSRTLVRGLNLRVEAGSMLAVLGRVFPCTRSLGCALHTRAGC